MLVVSSNKRHSSPTFDDDRKIMDILKNVQNAIFQENSDFGFFKSLYLRDAEAHSDETSLVIRC